MEVGIVVDRHIVGKIYQFVERSGGNVAGKDVVADLEAEAVLTEGKAAINLIHAVYRGGSVTGQGVYDLKNGKIIGETNIRNVTLDGEKTKGEKFLLNAALAGNGTYDREKGNLAVNVAANTMNLKWRDMLLNVMDFDADVTEKGVSVQTFSAFAGNGVMQGSGRVSFDGEYDLDATVQHIQASTRHYAKRQLTWWRRDTSILWQPA
jgi:hypothetical protein